MEKYEILNNKLRTAKSNFSKSQTRCSEEFEKYRKSKDAPRKRQERCAEDALTRLNLGEKLKVLMAAREDLDSEIDDQRAKANKPEAPFKTFNAEIDTY